MMLLDRKLLFAGLGILLFGAVWHESSWAQNVPPAAQPGSILNSETRYFNLYRNQPYLFRPIYGYDILPPVEEQETVLTIEEGVLPPRQHLQGAIMTPDGKVYIGPDHNTP